VNRPPLIGSELESVGLLDEGVRGGRNEAGAEGVFVFRGAAGITTVS
jgi:hypothetical protein